VHAFNRLSVQSKLMSMLLAVSIGSIVVIAYEGYRSGRAAIEDSVVKQLVGLRTSKARQIEAYFGTLRSEMKILGTSPSTAAAMKDFATSYRSVLGDSKTLDAQKASGLRKYYKDVFAPRLSDGTGEVVNSDAFLPASILSRYLQSAYIVDNANVVGEKEKLDNAGDGSPYSAFHQRHHPILRQIVEEFDYYDLFLIDPDGNIVYSVEKEADFATNLQLGPYARSGLARVYKEAQKQSSGYVAIDDFDFYAPSYGAPASFMATPIYQATAAGPQLVGVMAVQLPVEEINNVMTSGENWQSDGLGETGETFIVGADQRMRSNSRSLVQKPDTYFQALAAKQVNPEDINRIRQLETSVLLQPVTSEAVSLALVGQSGRQNVVNYLNEAVISAYAPLDIRGVDWVIVSEINRSEIFQPIDEFAQRVLIAAAGLVFLITLASLWLARAFLKPVNQLTDGFRRLAKGHKEVAVDINTSDELGELGRSFNHMVKKNQKTSELVAQKNRETETLLLNMFPASVAKRLKKGDTLIADEADSVTVLFANVLNFQRLTEELKPTKAIEILNEIVKALDDATENHGIEKIKTTGSEYLAVSGLSVPRLDHAKRVIDFSVEALRIVTQVNREWDVDLQMRVGVHTGGVMAGTVGSQRLIYDVWGNTVVTAHYVQGAATPGSIYVSQAVATSLADIYEFEPQGHVEGQRGQQVSVLKVEL